MRRRGFEEKQGGKQEEATDRLEMVGGGSKEAVCGGDVDILTLIDGDGGARQAAWGSPLSLAKGRC